jgi:hypothetical protein
MAEIEADDVSAPRLRLSEVGYTGLHVSNGQILEEARQELRFPESLKTYKKMALDTTLSSALGLYEMMVARVNWRCVPPKDPTPAEQAKTDFINSCMDDMEHSWFEFIKEATSMYTFGFSVHEKVYRQRLKRTGSKYNDGLIGLRKLPIRSQDTISKWEFDDTGRNLVGLEQDVTFSDDLYRFTTLKDTKVKIDRPKFLLFRTNVKRDNPEGVSLLKNCYQSWKWRTALEEHEAIGISREMRGIPVFYIPPHYMSPDAAADQKAIYDYYKRAANNLHMNEQAGMVMPMAYDPDSKQPLFKFELMSVMGTKGYDISEVISRYDNKMLMAFYADLLKMGQEKVGSFSLAGAKTSILAMAIEHRLKEIQTVLNKDLIPQLFALNKWADERLPTFEYEDLDEESLDEFSKAIQRIFSVNAVEFDRPVANLIRKKMGVEERDVNEKVSEDELPNNRSRSGDGGATPFEGTGTNPTKEDANAANKES